MFLARRKPKTTIFTSFFGSGSEYRGIYSVSWLGPSKKIGIYAVFSMSQRRSCFMPKAQNHRKLQCSRAWQAPKKQRRSAKSVQNGPPKRILDFFSHPEPPKTYKHHQSNFMGGRPQEAPRVAKAMLSNHHCTARHRRILAATTLLLPKTGSKL